MREALRRLTESLAVGGYWTRSNDVEVDLIGADRDAVADHIDFVGSIKWHDERGFDNHDLVDLLRRRDRVPGADPETPLIAVSRSGIDVDGLAAGYDPADLVEAWRS